MLVVLLSGRDSPLKLRVLVEVAAQASPRAQFPEPLKQLLFAAAQSEDCGYALIYQLTDQFPALI